MYFDTVKLESLCKHLGARLLFFLSVCTFVVFSHTASAATITVSPGSAVSVSSGDFVTVNLSISGLGAGSSPSLGVYDFTLAFDPSLLQYTGITWGTGLDTFGLGDIQSVSSSAGSIELYELSLDSPSDLNAFQPGAFLLDTIHFTGVGQGTSGLALSINALGDENGATLPATIVYGSGTVAVTPEPASWVLALTGSTVLWTAVRSRRKEVTL